MKLSVLTGIFLQIVYSLELDHIPPMPDIDQISTDEVILKVWGSDSLIGIYCNENLADFVPISQLYSPIAFWLVFIFNIIKY